MFANGNLLRSLLLKAELGVPRNATQMNAHFAFATIFALGLHGIKNKTELKIPPTSQVPPTEHATAYQRLPKDLKEATERFKAPNSLARK